MNLLTIGPGFKTRLVRYFPPSFWLITTIPKLVEHSQVCVEGRGRISRSGHTQDIKMGSCVFQCDVPHKWIAQQQVALCLYTVTEWGVMSCVCGMTFLCGSTLVKVPLLQAGTVAIWPQMFKSDVEPKQTKQTNYLMWPIRWSYFPEMQRSFCPMHSNRRWPARSYVGHH